MPRGPHQLPGDTRPSSAPVPSRSEFAPGLRKLKRPYPIILSSNKNSSPPSSLCGGGREDLGRKKESPSLSLPNYRVNDFYGELRWPQCHANKVRRDREMPAVPGDSCAQDEVSAYFKLWNHIQQRT